MVRKKAASMLKSATFRIKWKIMRGDKVTIMAGKDKGTTGVISKVDRSPKRPVVFVEGRNLVQKHMKKTRDRRGQLISIEAPIHYSNVQLIDPVNNSPVRCQWRYLEDGTRVRVSIGKNASGSIIPRPDGLSKREQAIQASVGVKDTPMAEATKVTYVPPVTSPNPVGFAASA